MRKQEKLVVGVERHEPPAGNPRGEKVAEPAQGEDLPDEHLP